MGFKTNTFSKSNFRTIITRKQAQFKRFARRFATATNMTEKRFLKAECVRICKELNQFCKQWKKCSFGSWKWITRNCKIGNIGSMTTIRRGRKTSIRGYAKRRFAKRYGRRTMIRKNRRTTTKARRTGWNTRYNRTNKARRSYVAW